MARQAPGFSSGVKSAASGSGSWPAGLVCRLRFALQTRHGLHQNPPAAHQGQARPRAAPDGTRGQPGVEPHQRHFSQGRAAFPRQAPISFRLRPAKVHGGVQQVRRRERGQRHRATGVRGIRHTAQAVQEAASELARQQSEVSQVFARLDSVQRHSCPIQGRADSLWV